MQGPFFFVHSKTALVVFLFILLCLLGRRGMGMLGFLLLLQHLRLLPVLLFKLHQLLLLLRLDLILLLFIGILLLQLLLLLILLLFQFLPFLILFLLELFVLLLMFLLQLRVGNGRRSGTRWPIHRGLGTQSFICSRRGGGRILRKAIANRAVRICGLRRG